MALVHVALGDDAERDVAVRFPARTWAVAHDAIARVRAATVPHGYRVQSATVSRRRSGQEVNLKVILHRFDSRHPRLARAEIALKLEEIARWSTS